MIMKHLKTFESFSYSEEPINEEFIGGIIKSILSIPFGIFALITLQFIGGRTMSKTIEKSLLDVYSNIDKLIDTLRGLSDNPNITDVEKKKINKRLKELIKVKKKNPTLDDYKRRLIKRTPLMNFKNRNYLRNQIESYEPREMSVYEIIETLKKFYKEISRTDVPGYQNHNNRSAFQRRLDDIMRNQHDDWEEGDEDINDDEKELGFNL